MTQNLVTLNLSVDTIAALDRALATMEEIVMPFVSLTAEEAMKLTKMGDKSEQFCRQTAMVLNQNRDALPPGFHLDDVVGDLADFDALRPRLLRLKEVVAKMEDTQMALGSDIMAASSEGYALMKMFGKAEGLTALQQAMLVRRPGRRSTGGGAA